MTTPSLGGFRVHRGDAGAQVTALDGPILDQLIADPFGDVRGNGEPDAVVAAAGRSDGRVDTDDLTPQIHQRAAAVAGIDGGVGLQEVLAIGELSGPPLAADDPLRDGHVETERAAECQHPVADLHRPAVAEFDGLQRSGVLDADDGDIGAGVGLDVGGDELTAVVQPDAHLIRSGHHVVVGHNHAVRVDDEPTASRLAAGLHLGPQLLPKEFLEPRVVAEELAEGEGVVVERSPPAAFDLPGLRGRGN
jgi:hypothetical protein